MRDSWSDLRAWATGLVCHAAMVLAVASSLSAQAFRESGAMFAPPDRQSLGILATSQELLDQGRYSEAVQLLVTILEAQDDYFFIAPNQTDDPNAGRQYQSLKNEARSVLSRLPPAAQQAYELRFGAAARQLLDDALADGDIEQALEVQRRYFGSAAGYEAMYLLGCYALNQGRCLTAIRHFQTLQSSRAAARYEPELSLKLAICWQRAGEPAESQAVLVDLQQRFPQARFALGGRSVELFRRSEDALEWLRNIAGEPPAENGAPSAVRTMFHHDLARQGRGSGKPNLSTQPVWRQAAADRLELALALQAQRDEFFRGAEVAVPSLTPLAVDDTVVMRTTQRLVAVDFKTGKRLWQVDQPGPESGAETPEGADDSISSYWVQLKQRSWLDMSYGSISSDGRAVFVLESSGTPSKPQDEALARQQRLSRPTVTVRPYNVLSAYDLLSRQGQRLWSVGGAGDAKPPLDQLVFLGPPLPLDGQLYVIAEIVDAIHLVVFSPRSGELLWSQQLTLIPADRRDRPLHRFRGISPSFAAGILICPTGVGAMVAVEPSTRRLLWAHEYRAARPAGPMIDASGTWTDSCAVISGRRVLITPGESLQMHCLDLLDGSHRWSFDRGNVAFLACVDRDLALVVGDRQLTAIELNTGKIAAGWPLPLPEGALPSGRGYHADGRYYLPLNVSGQGEVATIQLDPPAILDRAQWPGGAIPGNLICHQGQILSQNIDWLESIPQQESPESDADL
jgi:outer membrane protein assembly factor BamB